MFQLLIILMTIIINNKRQHLLLYLSTKLVNKIDDIMFSHL